MSTTSAGDADKAAKASLFIRLVEARARAASGALKQQPVHMSHCGRSLTHQRGVCSSQLPHGLLSGCYLVGMSWVSSRLHDTPGPAMSVNCPTTSCLVTRRCCRARCSGGRRTGTGLRKGSRTAAAPRCWVTCWRPSGSWSPGATSSTRACSGERADQLPALQPEVLPPWRNAQTWWNPVAALVVTGWVSRSPTSRSVALHTLVSWESQIARLAVM